MSPAARVHPATERGVRVDCMSDGLYGGRRFLTLNILNEDVLNGSGIEIETSLWLGVTSMKKYFWLFLPANSKSEEF